MDDSIPARLIADAISDLAADRVRAAWRYMDAWNWLRRIGVPLAEVRRALDTPPVDTQSSLEIRSWYEAGARGLIGLVGPVGTGKTYAAVRYLLARRADDNGLFFAAATWASLERDAKQRWLTRARTAGLLVLDDIGAGLTRGPWLRETLEGILLTRLGEDRGTILLSNATLDEAKAWLGGRVLDRLQFAGRLEEIEGESMRGPEDKPDAAGRGRRWHSARALLDDVGCEATQRHDEDGTPLPIELDVGRALRERAKRYGAKETDRVARALGLESNDVIARAQYLADAEHERDRATQRFEAQACEALAKLRREQIRYNEQLNQEIGEILAAAQARTGTPDISTISYQDETPPRWAVDEHGAPRRAVLRARGFTVRCLDHGGVQLLYRGRVHGDAQSEAGAWVLAAKLSAGF